mgnify:CR=1 FL=1
MQWLFLRLEINVSAWCRILGYVCLMFCPQILALNCVLNLCEWVFHAIQVRALIYFICKYVSNLYDCIFQDTVGNNSKMQMYTEKNWYTVHVFFTNNAIKLPYHFSCQKWIVIHLNWPRTGI